MVIFRGYCELRGLPMRRLLQRMAVAVITFAIGLWSVNHHDVEEVLSSSLSNKTTQKSLNPNYLHQTTEGTAAQQENRTERQKKAGQSQIQLSHTSAMNRYPDEYSAVQTYFRTEMSGGISDSDGTTMKNKKMLSFGAATGEEAITLASMYFSNSTFTVYGVDLDEGSLETAKTSAAAHSPKLDDGKIIFFNGQDTDISKYGPYDAIFANSVLCYHGTPGVNPQSILAKYPFAACEDSLGYLDANLNVGGVLAIVNTNYHMSDTKLHTRYKILAQCKNFVPKVDAESISYEKKKSDGMYDCVWVKQEAGEKRQ